MFNLFRSNTKATKNNSTASQAKYFNLEHKFESKLHSHAAERVLQCYLIAESQLQHSFIRPEINFKLRGKSAGTAHLHQNLLRFNATLLAENQDAFFNEVIPHEICHLLAHQMYGRVKPHGREWQALMIRVFTLSPSTTHSMDTQSVAGKHFSYQCDCGPVNLSIRRHNKVVRGETQYRCRRCKKELTLNL